LENSNHYIHNGHITITADIAIYLVNLPLIEN